MGFFLKPFARPSLGRQYCQRSEEPFPDDIHQFAGIKIPSEISNTVSSSKKPYTLPNRLDRKTKEFYNMCNWNIGEFPNRVAIK